MKAITTCNASLVAGTLAGDAQASWKDLCGSVAVFSTTERQIDALQTQW